MDLEGYRERSLEGFRPAEIARGGLAPVGGAMQVSARVRALSQVVLIRVEGSGSEFERREQRPGQPVFDVVFVERGSFDYLENGRWQPARSRVMIGPTDLPRRVRLGEDSSFVIARMPRSLLQQRTSGLGETFRLYERMTLAEQAMAAFIAAAIDSEHEASEWDSATIDHAVLELAGMVIRGRSGQPPRTGSPQATVRGRALAVIVERADEADLSPQQVARATGVSLRQLQAVFAAAGSSISAEIRLERARIAVRLLRDPAHDRASLSELALRAGFGSADSMRRTVEQLHGLTPKALRAGRGD